jgi:hypothetical protein
LAAQIYPRCPPPSSLRHVLGVTLVLPPPTHPPPLSFNLAMKQRLRRWLATLHAKIRVLRRSLVGDHSLASSVEKYPNDGVIPFADLPGFSLDLANFCRPPQGNAHISRRTLAHAMHGCVVLDIRTLPHLHQQRSPPLHDASEIARTTVYDRVLSRRASCTFMNFPFLYPSHVNSAR